MKLGDIYYFQQLKKIRLELSDIAEQALTVANSEENDKKEIELKLTNLAKVGDPNGEQRRQAVDFFCELLVFKALVDASKEPH